MNKPSVYFETTVVGHIAARQQSDIIVAARQLSSCPGGRVETNTESSSLRL